LKKNSVSAVHVRSPAAIWPEICIFLCNGNPSSFREKLAEEFLYEQHIERQQ
jgi:hypothetical protein